MKKKKVKRLKIFNLFRHNIKSTKNKLKIKKDNKKVNQVKEKTTEKNIKTKNNKEKKKPVKKKRSLWKKIITFILIMCIIGVLGLSAFLGYVVLSAPKFDESAFTVNDQTVIYDKDGEIITTIGTEKRESVNYDQLPQVLIDAIVATEDSKFFQHNGVDLLRFIKATIQQFLGQDAGGASTLTMQVAKNNLTKQGKIEKNIIEKVVRKFHDVYLAVFKIEKKYSKEEIFEFYVNSYYLGGSTYGVQAASKYYFDKDVSELTLPEAALIAGLFQSPGADNPFYDIDNATDRRLIVLKLMLRHGYITEEEYNYAKDISIESLLTTHSNENNFQGFVDTVTVEVKELTGLNPYVTPMKIYTTMDRSIQSGIDSIMNDTENGDLWEKKNQEVQAGVAVIDSTTGAIVAVGAGRNKTGIETFNYATSARRQPGSTAKPIFAYGPAIENNNLSSYTLYNDEKWGYSNGVEVKNWDNGYDSLVTMRYALQASRNIPAIKTFQLTGAKNSYKFASSLGLDVALNESSENYKILATGVDNTVNEAYAIGGVAEGFTPLEMAAAYAAFSNGGYYIEPYCVTKIEFRSTGEVTEYKYTKTRVMKESTAYIMNNMLESAVQNGGDGGAKVSGSHVAAKTGTTNYDEATKKKYNMPSNAVNDYWTIAYTSKYSVSLWYGYKEIKNENISKGYYNHSSKYKNNLMSAIMKYIPKDTKGWTKPSSVVASQVEIGTWPAELPSENTPESLITTEYFVRGTEPTTVSTRFANLNDVYNVTYNVTGNQVTLNWDFDTPTIHTKENATTYYSQSVFGENIQSFIDSISSDTGTYSLPAIHVNGSKATKFSFGNIQFSIYKDTGNGYELIPEVITENTFTTEIYTNTKFLIVAEYSEYKSNASEGIVIEVNINSEQQTDTDIGTETEKKLIVELSNTTLDITAGNYTYNELKSAYYDTYDVKNSITIKYQVIDKTTIKDFNKKEDMITYINTLTAGSYKLNYIVNYLDKETIVSQTININ